MYDVNSEISPTNGEKIAFFSISAYLGVPRAKKFDDHWFRGH
jgi:hypothetical protein